MIQFGVIPSANGPLARKLLSEAAAARKAAYRRRLALNDRVAMKLLVMRLRERLKAVGRPEKPTSVSDIIQAVAHKYGVNVSDIKSCSRRKRLCVARFEAIYEIASRTPYSFPMIGRLMGGRDHTTIMNAIKRHAERNNIPPDQVPRGMGY